MLEFPTINILKAEKMSLKDPANLVQRIPELEVLAADPKIRRAIETGDPFKVYRALGWAKWLKRLPEERDTLKTASAVDT